MKSPPIVSRSLRSKRWTDIDGNLAAIAWVVHHGYYGALPMKALVKGLRLRSGNVQVGDHALLESMFTETRFNGWAIGEVHVIDKKVMRMVGAIFRTERSF